MGQKKAFKKVVTLLDEAIENVANRKGDYFEQLSDAIDETFAALSTNGHPLLASRLKAAEWDVQARRGDYLGELDAILNKVRELV